jgi:hypothetical protein
MGLVDSLIVGRRVGASSPSPALAGEGRIEATPRNASQLRPRHCERSEAIERPHIVGPRIASSQGLLAMTDGASLTRSIR